MKSHSALDLVVRRFQRHENTGTTAAVHNASLGQSPHGVAHSMAVHAKTGAQILFCEKFIAGAVKPARDFRCQSVGD